MAERKSAHTTATAQLFFAAHFYLRLFWLLVVRSDFFSVPRSRKGKMQKRAVSGAILVASMFAARWVGWTHEDAPMLRRALPSGLALGARHADAARPRWSVPSRRWSVSQSRLGPVLCMKTFS